MKLSSLIQSLSTLHKAHGDIPLIFELEEGSFLSISDSLTTYEENGGYSFVALRPKKTIPQSKEFSCTYTDV